MKDSSPLRVVRDAPRLVVSLVSLIADGLLDLETTARSVLGDDLPLIGAAVTVEQLLTRSFVVGDHFDEDLDLDTSSRDTSHSS